MKEERGKEEKPVVRVKTCMENVREVGTLRIKCMRREQRSEGRHFMKRSG